MPLGFERHSNRSQQALEDPHAQRASQAISASRSQPPPQSIGIAPSGEEELFYDSRATKPYQPAFDSESGQHLPTNNTQESDGRNFQGFEEQPSRSHTQRYSAVYHQPPSPVVGIQRAGTVSEQISGNIHKSYAVSGPITRPQEHQPQPVPAEHKKSKSRGVFGIFSSKTSRPAESQIASSSSDHNNDSSISRKASKGHKAFQSSYKSNSIQGPPGRQQFQSQQQQYNQQQQQGVYQSENSSESHLPSPREQDEDDDQASYLEDSTSQFGQVQKLDQHQQPTIRLASVDPTSKFRAVDDSPNISQYLQHQNLSQQQQRLAQHQLQFEQQQQHHSIQPGIPSSDNLQPSDYQVTLQQPGQYQSHSGSTNQVYTNTAFHSHQNSEVVSQLSHDSPVDQNEDQRPPSCTTQTRPSTGEFPGAQSEYLLNSTPVQASRSSGQQSTMPPQAAPNAQNRRSTDIKQVLGGGDIRGAPPAYSQQFSGSGQSQNSGRGNTVPSTPQNAQQTAGTGFRESTTIQRERADYGQSAGGEQGRSTSPLPTGGDMSDYDKLVIKYKKVKGLYFEKQGQVEQLQNTLANQRLSQSRTSLDDSEYATRFSRLDGAIKEIAFSIRKDWKTIPRWLAPYVNQDAQKVGTKEMTAVGRACISRWIYDEVFSKCFHPGLEARLSAELKAIENNIRFFSSTPTNQEEANALTNKVIQWKLATVDGLASQLDKSESLEAREQFTRITITKLTAHLINHLQEPAPQGISGSTTSIIELAVGIAAHLPRESRDISITYPLPGEAVQPTCMKVEPALPALENPSYDETEASSSSTGGEGKDGPDNDKGDNRLKKAEKGKGGLMTALGTSGSRDGRKGSISSQGGVDSGGDWEKKDGSAKLRYAGFVGVEVRGRQWLVNAPVWTV